MQPLAPARLPPPPSPLARARPFPSADERWRASGEVGGVGISRRGVEPPVVITTIGIVVWLVRLARRSLGEVTLLLAVSFGAVALVKCGIEDEELLDYLDESSRLVRVVSFFAAT